MLIEVKGVQFVNKGAGLMLRAVVDRLRAAHPDVEFALTPGPNAPYRDIAAAGAWQRLRVPGAPFDADAASYHLPRRVRELARRYGAVTERDVTAVLDASGFTYGAAWGDASLDPTAGEIERLARHDKPYLFLPQTFGPFDATAAARRFGRSLQHAALVAARDTVSRDHVANLAGPLGDRLEVYPDFTLTLPGDPTAATRWGIDRGTALLIPNAEMQGARNPDLAWRNGYLPLLRRLAVRLSELGFVPRVLNHEGAADAALCEALRDVTGGAEVITATDPLALKGIIGAAGIVACSRYHGCASALAQGVPCLGTAWSHKYGALFADFGVGDCLVERCVESAALARLDRLVADRAGVQARLAAARPLLDARIDSLWQRVLAALAPVASPARGA